MKNFSLVLLFQFCIFLTLQKEKNNKNQSFKQKNYFNFGKTIIPHDDKKDKGGEDACYVNDQIIAVADGVGGWNNKGIDPSLYSKELCFLAEKLFKNNPQIYIRNPKQLIIDSARKNRNIGSSTFVILTLDDEENKIYASYIGDSGYIVFKPLVAGTREALQVLIHSQEQLHGFNFPFQIGSRGDPPKVAIEHTYVIEKNDIIVVGSDGLFDNLNSSQISEIILKHLENNLLIKDIQKLTEDIAKKAYELSLDENYFSPFDQKAKLYNINITGGKPDDITVIVAQIFEKVINNKINESSTIKSDL